MTYRATDAKEVSRALSWLSKYWNRPIQPDYHEASTVNKAVSLLSDFPKAKILAGGTDLVGLMKNKVIMPDVLVNIHNMPRMNRITESADGIDIETLVTINDIERSSLIQNKYPVLFETASSISSPQIRNVATIGGNLCQDVRCWYYRRSPVTGISFNCRRKCEDSKCYALGGENQHHAIIGATECFAVCPSDMATTLLALDARITTVDTSGGRVIPIEEFYTPFGNILKPDELITSIQVPAVEPEARQRFLKFRRRKTIDFAVVSAAAVIKLHENTVTHARIVLGGVASQPYRALKAEDILIGRQLTEQTAARAAKAAVEDARPLSKNSFKAPVAETLVKRAILD